MIISWKRKELGNATGLACFVFRHGYRILKLHIIGSRRRSVLMCKQSILVPPHFVCSGDGTSQIVFSKQKLSINTAAYCNKHILWSRDAIPTLCNAHESTTVKCLVRYQRIKLSFCFYSRLCVFSAGFSHFAFVKYFLLYSTKLICCAPTLLWNQSQSECSSLYLDIILSTNCCDHTCKQWLPSIL